MKISTKARYGLRALIEIAANSSQVPLGISSIAERQEIPPKYLEQIIPTLKQGGLVKSTRGARGGYTLARKPETIRLNRVVELLDGPIVPVECIANPDSCKRVVSCAAREVWVRVGRAVMDSLDSMTLQDLVDRHAELSSAAVTDYSI